MAWQLAPDAGPDVAEQRLIASERSLVGLAAKARADVADDGDRSGDDVDDLAGVLVGRFEFALVVPVLGTSAVVPPAPELVSARFWLQDEAWPPIDCSSFALITPRLGSWMRSKHGSPTTR
jgi:hypothetical protein